jgi:hypothetical protein
MRALVRGLQLAASPSLRETARHRYWSRRAGKMSVAIPTIIEQTFEKAKSG